MVDGLQIRIQCNQIKMFNILFVTGYGLDHLLKSSLLPLNRQIQKEKKNYIHNHDFQIKREIR